MAKITDNNALKSAKALKEYCEEHPKCEGCVFRDNDEWDSCTFMNLENPCNWEFVE